MSQMTVSQIPVRQIVPGPNDRTVFTPERLQDLACSIQQNGLAQPLTVRPLAGTDRFEIVAGERRFRALTQILGHKTVPCVVRNMSDEMAAGVMLTENCSRQDLSPMEEARAFQARIRQFGWTAEEVAETAGVSKDLVKRRLGLLNLVADIQHLVATGNLPLVQAECLVTLDQNRQMSALRVLQAAAHPLSTPAFRAICQQLYAEQQQDGLFALEAFWMQQVQQDAPLPTRGKKAVTGAPVREDLPAITGATTDTVGHVFDTYIARLVAHGNTSEAATLGTMYTFLVQNNWVRVPEHAVLLAEKSA